MQIEGLPVVNAKRPVVLSITKRDIKSSKSKQPGACAAARCALRSVKDVKEVRVHIARVFLLKGKRWIRYHTPRTLRDEVITFDRGGRFVPGEHILTPMPPSRRTGRRTGTSKNDNRHPHRKKRKAYDMVKDVRTFGWNRKEVV